MLTKRRRLCVPAERIVCNRAFGGSLESYDSVVDDYIRQHRAAAERERSFFQEHSLELAIRNAALCKRSDGKRHQHHLRRSRETLAEAASALLAKTDDLRACQTFDELYQLIWGTISPIKGIGRLVVYDVATWIGAHLGLGPDRVYLHAGAAKGARALGIRGHRTVNKSKLPAAFGRLRYCEIEDCLCLYKGDIARIAERS